MKPEGAIERSPKRRRKSEVAIKQEPNVQQSSDSSKNIGSVIGRKRKERQLKKRKAT